MADEIRNSLSYFDRAMGSLQGLPDVVHAKPSTIPVVPTFGIGTQTYVVQTYRQREIGDSIFLQVIADGVSTRIVIPPAIADVIARQRDQLNTKSRSRAGKRIAEDLKSRGIEPGFMKHKKQ